MARWTPHYTGIEIYQGWMWYIQRDTKTKRVQYVRLDLVWYGWGWRSNGYETSIWMNHYRRAPFALGFSKTFRHDAVRERIRKLFRWRTA